MLRVSRLLRELGYCGKNDAKSFLRKNRVTLADDCKTILTPKSLVEPTSVLVNGEKVQHIGPMSIFVYKHAGLKSAYPAQKIVNTPSTKTFKKSAKAATLQRRPKQSVRVVDYENMDPEAVSKLLAENSPQTRQQQKQNEIDDTIFKLLPPLFVKRYPVFFMPNALPPEIGGLEFLTQYENLPKYLTSVKNPLPRTYEIRVRDNFTGLEQEALPLLRGQIKKSQREILEEPVFEVLDEKKKIARITLFDYKPDRIIEMLVSMRHEPEEITRIGLGHILIETEAIKKSTTDDIISDSELITLEPGSWMECTDDHLYELFEQRRIYEEEREDEMESKQEERLQSEIERLEKLEEEDDKLTIEYLKGALKAINDPNSDFNLNDAGLEEDVDFGDEDDGELPEDREAREELEDEKAFFKGDKAVTKEVPKRMKERELTEEELEEQEEEQELYSHMDQAIQQKKQEKLLSKKQAKSATRSMYSKAEQLTGAAPRQNKKQSVNNDENDDDDYDEEERGNNKYYKKE